MKAAILEKIGAPLTIADIEAPAPMHGQVLIKMLCAGICGSQLHEIDGSKGSLAHLPHLLGHEGCGIVEKVGYGVRTASRGDKVVLHWRKGEGCEAEVPVYSNGIKSGPITTFSEYVVVSENRVTRIDDDVPDDFVALLGCALSTALATVENQAQVKWGESVLIVGCGGIGLSMIAAAKLAHALICAFDLEDSKRALAQEMGATWFKGEFKFDVIIDTVGSGVEFHQLADSGRYILVGQSDHVSFVTIDHRIFDGQGKSLKATQGGGFNPTRDIPRYINLWRSNALNNYRKLITHRIPLNQINEGIQLMRDGKTGRVMIEYDR